MLYVSRMCCLPGILIMLGCLPCFNTLTPPNCDGVVDLVFLIDSSESMIVNDPYNQPYFFWNLVKQVLRGVIHDLPVDDGSTRIGILQFADDVQHILYLNDAAGKSSADIQNMVTNVQHTGGITFTKRALDEAKYSQFASGRHEARKVAIVITDGLSNRDQDYVTESANNLKNDAEVFSVGVSRFVDEDELKAIATPDSTGRHYLELSDTTELVNYINTLVHRVCNIPDPTPPGPDVLNCEVKTDLALLIDNSGSIRDANPNGTIPDSPQDNYYKLRFFMSQLVDRIGVSPDTNRIAAIRFSKISKLEFLLDRYGNVADVKRALLDMEFDGQFTNISGAIQMARDEVFQQQNGDRPDVRNVVMLITDGKSNKDEEQDTIVADAAKAEGVIFFVAGITEEIDELTLRNIASKPEDVHYYNTTSISNLNKIFTQLLNHICNPSTTVKRDVSNLECVDENCYVKSNIETVDEPLKKASSGFASSYLITDIHIFMTSISIIFNIKAFITKHLC